MKKAILVQLPVPGFVWPILDANIPLAAGYLASWKPERRAGWSVEILPWTETDILGDEAILRVLLSRKPDLVGFSLYLWNAERSLYLARKLADAGVRVAAGGPEVSPDNACLWGEGTFFTAIQGEGEESFGAVLRSLTRGARVEAIPGVLTSANVHLGGGVHKPVDLSDLSSPYLAGVIDPSPDGSVWLETQRGCPFPCAYCHYGKGFGAVRPFPEDWLSSHLAWALKREAREVYLMDPSFNVRSDWERVVRVLEEGNPDGRIRLHTELVAEALRPGDGARLARAGLRSCEIGLQSISEQALAKVGRAWNRTRWLRGVRELLDAGVSVTVGLIVGLPGDDLEGFERSLSFLGREVPRAGIQVFPLSVLPGTELAGRTSEMGLTSLPVPPYTVTGTSGYSHEDIRRAFDLFEEATGFELDPFGPPALGGAWEPRGPTTPPYLSGVRLRAEQVRGDWPEFVAPAAARNLCVWIQGWSDQILPQLQRLSRLLPHGVLSVVLDDGVGWPPERLSSILAQAGTGQHYLDRYFSSLYGTGARIVPRLAVWVPAEGDPPLRWLEKVRQRADIVWSLRATAGWTSRVVNATREGEAACLQGEPSPEELFELSKNVAADAGEILFSSEAATSHWRALRVRGFASDLSEFRAEEHRIALG